MQNIIRIGLLTTIFVLLGCSDKSKNKSEDKAEAEGTKMAVDYLISSGQKDIKKIKNVFKTKKFGDVSSEQAVLLAALENKDLLKSKDPKAIAFVKEAKQIAKHDYPLAYVKSSAEKIRKIRKKKPGEQFMSECAYFEIYLKQLKQFGFSKEAKPYEKLLKDACK